MARIIYSFFLLVIITLCCKSQNEDFNQVDEVEFLEIDQITFPIDDETSFSPRVHGYSTTINKIYIWNELNSSIYLFDIDTPENTQKITIELGPSTGVYSVNHILFQSQDSVYLFDNRAKRLHLYIPSKSEYQSHQVLGTEAADPSIDPSTKSFWIDDKSNAFIVTKPIPDKTANNLYTSLLKYNLTTNKREFLLPFPDDYKKDFTKLYERAHFAYDTRKHQLLYSLPYSQEIYVIGQNGSIIDSIPSNSDKVKPYDRPQTEFTNPVEGQFWAASLSKWIDITYDPYRNLIYRTAFIGYQIPSDLTIDPNERRKTVNGDNSYSTTLVFDASYNKIAEIPSEPFTALVSPIPTPQGIFQLVGSRKELKDENLLIFKRFEVRKKQKD